MSLFDKFRPRRSKPKLEELKLKLQFNPNYYRDLNNIKLERELNSFM